ncbi:MAG TPA: ABC transporter permease [Vicinamibacteria bacterium]|nr:ABC transporter permease [Vicinamibacteria bacterium]
MSGIVQDLRLALRAFGRKPGFAAVVVLTLALGSGANTAIFTLLDQVMIRPLPVVERPERLVVLSGPGPFSGWTESSSATVAPFSQPMFLGLRDRAPAFAGVLAHYRTQVHVSVAGQTDAANGDLVSGSFFQVLGLRPALGRLLTPDDDLTPSGHPVAVLGHGFFLRRFGGDASVVGRTIAVNSHPLTVVGVAPPGFNGVEIGSASDVYVPLSMQQEVQPTWGKRLGDWRSRWLECMARLRDGVSVAEARASTDLVYAQLLQEDLAHLAGPSARFRQQFLGRKLEMWPGGRGTSGLRDQSGTPLVALMAMVGLVLLIACANVASLLLTRASARQKETAVRQALGAGRLRLVRLQLVESVVLSLAGGLVGLQLAFWVGQALIRALPFSEAQRTLSAAPDLRIGAFTLAVSVLAGVAFGLLPALRAGRGDLAPTLKTEAGAVVGGGAHFRLRRGLVVAQVALSLLLLIGAGLFTRSLMNLRSLDPGFRADRLYTFTVDPSRSGQAFAQRAATLRRIQEELAADPEVVSASAAAIGLMTGNDSSRTVHVDGYLPKEGEDMNPNFNYVAPGFFATAGMPLVAGRDLQDGDVLQAPKVAVVNEVFARYFFGGGSPVGRRFGVGRKEGGYDIEIVGVVRDGKSGTLREQPLRFVYQPYTQEPAIGGLTFYVRSKVDSAALPSRLREAVRRVDASLPVTDLKTMQAQIGESLFVERMVAALSAAFGLLATVLAAVGLYSVMSHAVAMRTREIGLRVALGADGRSVLLMVLREVVVLAALGIGVGLPGGFGLGRLIESQLFGLTARDPLTFGVATLTLVATALAAGLVPAVRAARVDPMTALRYE